MRMVLATVAGVVLLAQTLASAQTVSDLTLPVSAADLASTMGLGRTDPSTLALDLVRIMYSSPHGEETLKPRAEIGRLLRTNSTGADRLPLPLTPKIWREHLLQANVPDDRLAAAILGQRVPALIYHGLMGVDETTLRWLTQNPATLDHFRKYPGTTAVFARSLHINDGAIVTPGEKADDVWSALVGVPPSNPEQFIGRLLGARNGRLAFLFDTVMHLDAAHQKLALTAAPGESRIARARALLDAVSDSAASWKLEERPFTRPDVDVSLVLRLVRVNDAGVIQGLTSRRVWHRAFGERDEASETEAEAPIDAAWLTSRIVRQPGAVARARLDMFLLAQRVLGDQASGESTKIASQRTVEALRGMTRFPALALTLERSGVRGVDQYYSAARMAAALERDVDDMALTQSILALVDDAHRASSVPTPHAAELMAALVDVAGSGHDVAPHVVEWFRTRLVPGLRADLAAPTDLDTESLVTRALAGPSASAPPTVEWEGRRYAVDVGAAERMRIARIRKGQGEPTLDRALALATTRAGIRDFQQSLAAMIYAVALGDPDGPAVAGGPVWRRHRFTPEGPGASEGAAWRLASESFGPAGWRLTGSLLALESAIPRLALRRLDPTAMPAAGRIGTSDRHTMLLSVALLQPSLLTNDDQRSIAQDLEAGRERVRALTSVPDRFADVARDAGLSEWRTNALAWMLGTDKSRAPSAFTLVELWRLGHRAPRSDAWGAAATPVDGSLLLRFPEDAWEEYCGRPGAGVLASQLADVALRTAETLDALHLPASIARHVAAFAMQDVVDRAQPGYFDDFLSIASAARDLEKDRFEDYVAALTASGPLVPLANAIGRQP